MLNVRRVWHAFFSWYDALHLLHHIYSRLVFSTYNWPRQAGTGDSMIRRYRGSEMAQNRGPPRDACLMWNKTGTSFALYPCIHMMEVEAVIKRVHQCGRAISRFVYTELDYSIWTTWRIDGTLVYQMLSKNQKNNLHAISPPRSIPVRLVLFDLLPSASLSWPLKTAC